MIVSAIGALGADWVALGDRAVIATRAHDVLSGDSPLLGQHSSTSLPGRPAYGAGPMLFWVLAVPARLGSDALVVAAALVNVLSVMGTVALAHRRRGPVFMFVVALALVVMCGSLPNEALHDIWNAYIPVLPFTLLVFLCWSLACGDHRLLPVTVAVASLVAQCHLALVLPSAAALAIGIGGMALARRWSERPVPIRRWLVASAVVALVFWAAPVVDQAIHRPGNAVELVRSSGDQGETVGLDWGRRAVVRTAGLPPWWLGSRLDVGDRVDDLYAAPGAFQQATAILLLAGLAVLVALALRRRDAGGAAAGAIGLALCLALAVVAAATPVRSGLPFTLGYTVDWSAPTGMWLYLAPALVLLARVRRPVAGPRLGAGAAGAMGLAAVVAASLVVALPRGEDADQGKYAPAREALRALKAELPREDAVQVEASQTSLAFDLHAAVVYELLRDGRDAVSVGLTDRLGGHHTPDEHDPEHLVFIRDESAPPAPGPGRVVARVTVELPPLTEGGRAVERRVALVVSQPREP